MRRTDPTETGQTTTRFQPHRVTTEPVKLPNPFLPAVALTLVFLLPEVFGDLVRKDAGVMDRVVIIVPMTVVAYTLTSWVSRLVRWHKQR